MSRSVRTVSFVQEGELADLSGNIVAEPLTQQELRELQTRFKQSQNGKKQKGPKVLKVRMVRRQVFTEEDHWRIIYARYGSFTDFSQIQQSQAEIG